jgi:hypothetical protein
MLSPPNLGKEQSDYRTATRFDSGHESFRLEIADHFRPFVGGKITINVNKALAFRFQDRHNLFAVVDFELRDQFAIGYGVPAGQKQFFGITAGIRNRMENSFLPTALFPPKPVEAGQKDRQGNTSGHSKREDKKENVIRCKTCRSD